MRLLLVVAVLAIILVSTTGIGCRGDLNATSGCDKTCKKRCPGPKPAVCECPKTNSCMCRRPYVYDPVTNKCVKLKDCSPPTEGDSTTGYVNMEDEPTKEDTTKVEPIIEGDETTTECITTTNEPTTKEIITVKMTTEEDNTTTDCITTTDEAKTEENKTITECIDEITTESIATKVEPITDCIGTSDEPTTECVDTTDALTTECINITDETTTECVDTTDEPTTECVDTTDEPITECIDTMDELTTEIDDDCDDYTLEPVTITLETTTGCNDYDELTTVLPITTTNSNNSGDKLCQCLCSCPGGEVITQEPTTITECEDESTENPITEIDETNKATTECNDEITTNREDEIATECKDETTTESDDSITFECDDEITTECEYETTTECEDEITTECDDKTTTECENETTTETDNSATYECEDETTTECENEITTECDDETTTESEDETTIESDDSTTTECDDEITEAPTTTEVTTTEAIPTLEDCPEAIQRLKQNLYALHLTFLSSYGLTFPGLSFSGAPLASIFLLNFLTNFAQDPLFSDLTEFTGLNTRSEIVCVSKKLNKIAVSMSTGLVEGISIAVKSNYTFTSAAERFMKEVIVGKLLTFSSNSSLSTLNEAISNSTNNKINNVINIIDDSDQMLFLSGVSHETAINSNKSIIKPFYETPFKYAPANYTIVRGTYNFTECPSIQAKLLKIYSVEGDYSIIIVLPFAPFTVLKNIEKTSAESLWKCIQSMKPSLVNVELPQINTNTTINSLKLLKYANISSTLTSSAEYKNMLVGESQINLTKDRQHATLQITSAEPLTPSKNDVHSIVEPQYFFIANTPYYQFIAWPELGDMPFFASVITSFAPGHQTSVSDG